MVTTSDTRWVLIAEDDEDIRELIRNSITSEAEDGVKVEIVEAKDGVEALSQATHRQFHCVVTDLRMPRSTGEEFIRSLQTHPLNASTPMLVISGHAREEFKEFCDRYSHIKVIPKPFEPNDVAKAVLREIKLGRLDHRICIHLMNPFVEAVGKFLNDDLQLDAKVHQPGVKKPGEAMLGEYHCTLLLTTGITKARFTLSFDKQILDFARTKFFQPRMNQTKQWPGMNIDDCARLVIQSLLERASERIAICMGGEPRLAGLSIVTAKHEDALEDLIDCSGANCMIRTDQGRVCAGAYSRPKGRQF